MTFPRSSGVLLHPTCLPSAHGIGDLGGGAYEFVNFLERSGQRLWQILPLGPTGYEHSPYIMNFSTFAGNPLLISLEQLADAGLLRHDELAPIAPNPDLPADRIDFDRVIAHKTPYLERAFHTFEQRLAAHSDPDFERFCQTQAYWLDDYALFMALLDAQPGTTWNQWEPAIARRDPKALAQQRETHRDRIRYHQFLQFQFFRQWANLRAYANQRNIKIIGDISIYVCYNSADVWQQPDIFELDSKTLEPKYIAGVPPDYFSETGQLWGNPVYNWNRLKATRFDWWLKRFEATLQYVDWVRIDHFRGFEAFWRVPAGETTAIKGKWIPAPGEEFFAALHDRFGQLPVLAEDLGVITPPVEALRDQFGLPGMRILLFAFGGGSDNPYLPHNYVRNCLVYTGTHDNDTTVGWWQEKATPAEKQFLADYLGYRSPDEIHEIHWDLIRLALSSIADLAIIPLQDLLGLDNRARMNDPSVNEGNWRWRYLDSGVLHQGLSDRLLDLTRTFGRCR